MRPNLHKIGFILLSIYLIIIGLDTLFPDLPLPTFVAGIIALFAGVIILLSLFKEQ